ncbi:hypothetical protein PR202_ga15152 [Eleusine coracana subsp. coracana]|uniref:Uncharacterized protein n=1 Tax=Eleusine coracana subsp. coracana TaxID=191504 RepID=A0AAV5CID7_ELECO|nr:hypothetical protein PR202_ga15152 [Eleusine coracana subsp. coracana]
MRDSVSGHGVNARNIGQRQQHGDSSGTSGGGDLLEIEAEAAEVSEGSIIWEPVDGREAPEDGDGAGPAAAEEEGDGVAMTHGVEEAEVWCMGRDGGRTEGASEDCSTSKLQNGGVTARATRDRA